MKNLVKEKRLSNFSEVTQPKSRFEFREIAPVIKLYIVGDTWEMRKGKNWRDFSEVTQRTWKWIEGMKEIKR